jgi:hypothetical protein
MIAKNIIRETYDHSISRTHRHLTCASRTPSSYKFDDNCFVGFTKQSNITVVFFHIPQG